MSERKVLNKYFPPDFDPSKIPRRRLKDKNQQQVIRLMAPFSMRCTRCGEYIYKGKKFNARKETVLDEDYMGIKIFRFYIKCTLCSSEITFKTDPKNADYTCEHGAQRNFESWREDEAAHASASYMPGADEDGSDDEDGGERRRQREEEQDAMKLLEASTEASKREMEILDALQDIRTRNARHQRAADSLTTTPASLLAASGKLTPEDLQRLREAEEDEQLVRAVFARVPGAAAAAAGAGAGAGAAPGSGSGEGKGKGRALAEDYGSSDDDDDDAPAPDLADPAAPPTLSIKRKLAPAGADEPSLSALLAQKGLAPTPAAAAGAARQAGFGFGAAATAAAAAKKRKVGGIPGVVVKKKPVAK